MSTQAVVNYTDYAQRRVACDTLCIQRKATMSVSTDGTGTLPVDCVRIEGLYQDATQIERASVDDLLTYISAGTVPPASSTLYAAVVSRTLYLIPKPSEATTLTLIYKARPVTWDPDLPLEVSGPWEALVDQLVQTMMQHDSGQTGVTIAAYGAYDDAAAKLRRRAGAKPGGTGRLRRVGMRRQV